MKYLLIILFLFLFGFVYLVNTSPNIRHMYNLITDRHAVSDTPLVYKDLNTVKDLSGEYIFSCKYPEIYDIGIGIKKNDLNLKGKAYNWLENSPIRFKIEILSKKGDVIFSKKVNNFIIGSLFQKNEGFQYVATTAKLSNCENLRLRISLISGNFMEYENKNLLYLYVSVSGHI